MVIDRNKHNKYSTNQIYGTLSLQQLTELAGSGSNSGTTIIYQGGGSGLTEEQKKKLDSIEEGAQVNQNAFSKVTISDGSITNEITANDPSDNVTFLGVSPIKLSLIDGVIQISYDGVSLWQVDEDGNLWTDRNVYSTKEISAYGYGDGELPTGAQYLYELKDVDSATASNPVDKGILQYDSITKKWIVTDGSNIKPDLTGYATLTWVTEQIDLLIGSAPDVLDTIYEIAEALNNDPDYVKDIANNLSNLTNRVVKLEDMFEWDGDKIKAKADLYGVGEISAYGYGSGEAPTGALYLHELKDVTLTEITAGQLLQWDGLKWVNINKDEVGLNESELNQFLIDNNYAKISDINWDNVLNKPDSFTTSISDITDLNLNWYTILNTEPTDYVTRWPQFSEITNKPNTLEGYGITDGVNSVTLTGSGNAVTTASINGHVITLTKGSTFSLSTHNHDSVYVNVIGDTMTGTLTLPTIVVNTRILLGNAYIEYDSTNNAVVIKNKTTDLIVNFYATGEVSAYGYGDGTSPSGVTYLYELKDVDLTSISENDMLKWNGEKWVNIPMSSIAGASSWDEITGKPSWIGDTKPSYTFAEITSKPTTLAGYGITDAYTKTDSDSRYVNVSGDSMTGQLNLQVNGTVPLNIDNTNENQESCLRVQSGGVSKSAFGWANVYGTYMYDYTSNKYLYILNGVLRFDGNQILDTGNYSTTLDTRYVKKAGDTMTGTLYMPHSLVGISEADANKYSGSNTYYNLAVGWKEPYHGLSILLYRPDSTKQAGIGWSTTNADHAGISLEANSNDLSITNLKGGIIISGLKNNTYPLILKGANKYSVINFKNDAGTDVTEVGWLNDARGNCSYIANINTNSSFSISNDGIWYTDNNNTFKKYKVWHAGNGGSGSGLDADLLDGFSYDTYESYRKTTIDASSLDNNTWYPVVMLISTAKRTRIRIEDVTNTNATWNNRADKNMGLVLDYVAVGSSWGWVNPNRIVYYYNEGSGTANCLRGLGQLTNNSAEYIYVRGGAKYNFYLSHFIVPKLYTTTYTGVGGQTISPTTSIPAAITRDAALITDNVSSATKLQTPRTIWGKSFDGTGNVDGCLRIQANEGNYREGIRIKPHDNWTTILLGGNDLINEYGTSANSWSIHNNNGIFAINRNGSTGHTGYELCNINGNWGIGTTSPSYQLHVVGLIATSNYGKTIAIGSQNSGYCHYVTDANIHWFNTSMQVQGNLSQYEPNNNPIYTCGTSTARWANIYSVAGNFSGAVTMSSTLSVSGAITASNGILTDYEGSYWITMATRTNLIYSSTNQSTSNAHALYRVKNSNGDAIVFGGLGVNTGFYGFKASTISAGTNNPDWLTIWDVSNGTINHSGSIYVSGNIVASGEITAYSSSDIRLKTNLKELKAINTLRKINTFEYDWTEEALSLKTNKNKHDYGIIAQELIEIIPEAVTTNMYDKGYYGIDYVKLIPFTISAIKEVDDEVTTLKNRVKELEERLSKYESNIK